MQALTDETPVRELPGVRIRDVKTQPKDGFDVEFQLQSGQRRICVYGEIKPAASPKLLELRLALPRATLWSQSRKP